MAGRWLLVALLLVTGVRPVHAILFVSGPPPSGTIGIVTTMSGGGGGGGSGAEHPSSGAFGTLQMSDSAGGFLPYGGTLICTNGITSLTSTGGANCATAISLTPGTYPCPTLTLDSTGQIVAVVEGVCTGGGSPGVSSLTGTANQILVSAPTGPVTLSIPNNPTLPGVTTGSFLGPLAGNATTATAAAQLTQDPLDFGTKGVTRPFSEVADSTALPTTCTANRDWISVMTVDPDDCRLFRCNDTGTGWTCALPPSVTPPSPMGTAIRVTGGTAVQTIRYDAIPLSGVATIGLTSFVLATVGTGGATLTMPDSADPLATGYLKIVIVDTGTGNLTLVPFGDDTINGFNTPAPAVTGLYSGYQCWILGTGGGWYCEELGAMLSGTLQLPMQAAKLPLTDSPYIDSSSFNTKLVFDTAVKQCAVWEFTVPVDSPTSFTSPTVSLWYTMSTGITGGISVDISLLRVIANTSTLVNSETGYGAVTNCDQTVPTVTGTANFLFCSLTNNGGLTSGDAARIKICRNTADTFDTAAGLLEIIRARMTYRRQ